jgi:hypothetical protein
MMLMSEDSWERVNDAGRRFCPAIIGEKKGGRRRDEPTAI